MAAQLREGLRSDLQKLNNLLGKADAGATGTLDKLTINTAINECAFISKKAAMVQVALERADTEGTGAKINISVAFQHLTADLLAEMEREHVEEAREVLKDKRAKLIEQIDARAAHGFIEAQKLRTMLSVAPFDMSPDVINSIMRFFGVKEEAGDSVRISEIMRTLCPMLDQVQNSQYNYVQDVRNSHNGKDCAVCWLLSAALCMKQPLNCSIALASIPACYSQRSMHICLHNSSTSSSSCTTTPSFNLNPKP